SSGPDLEHGRTPRAGRPRLRGPRRPVRHPGQEAHRRPADHQRTRPQRAAPRSARYRRTRQRPAEELQSPAPRLPEPLEHRPHRRGRPRHPPPHPRPDHLTHSHRHPYWEWLIARCHTIQGPVEPVAYDWVKLVVVRQGSAILLSEFGERHIKVGDVLVLGTQTLCGTEPEGAITVTALYLDRDYVIDQIFWLHISLLTDRLDAQDFAQELYFETALLLRLVECRMGMLWLRYGDLE